MDQALTRALASLKGLSIGDALGETYFHTPRSALSRIKSRTLPAGPCRYTDDTQMAISVVECLREHGRIEQDDLARRFAERLELSRGYGFGALQILEAIRHGADWRTVSAGAFHGEGSFGNGGAMRIAPLGAYFAGDRDATVENARLSAVITHHHAEGVAGAVAVALAASFAASVGPGIGSDPDAFYTWVINGTPWSRTREGIERAATIDPGTTAREAASILGSGQNVSAQDTVPFVIWSAASHTLDFREAFWNTVAGLGDRDTTCAMVCGIVAAASCRSIPEEWRERTESLPPELEIDLRGERSPTNA